MDTEAVFEFLGCLALLQGLPISSLKKISQLLIVRHYESGEHVVREGEIAGAIYFIWEGEAEVTGKVNVDDGNSVYTVLKRYDYIGRGITASGHHADVIASAKLTCLVLLDEHCHLLQPKSLWSADKTRDECSPVENILNLDLIEANVYQGITLLYESRTARVFGGQFIGQALAAASKTMSCLKVVHSLHAYFLLGGDLSIPIIYKVQHLRDGKNFATREVQATQKGNVVFSLVASFQKEEESFDHQEATMPPVPSPEELRSMEKLFDVKLTDPSHQRSYRSKMARLPPAMPLEIRFCEPINFTNQTKSLPRLNFWFRSKGKLSDDQSLHRCVVAYASDTIFFSIRARPHRKNSLKTDIFSLDHSMWFHRPVKADDWLLFAIPSPSAYGARGFVFGQVFNRKGELVVSVAQEGLLSVARTPAPATTSKM